MNSPNPLVSVVIATMDRPEFLREALASAVGQTLQDIEIIVSDDAGEIDASAVVAEFADPRIRLYRHESRRGIEGNVCSAMRKARGTYIANLHDDDLWEPDFLRQLVEELEATPEAVLAFCDYWIIDQEGAIDEQASKEHSAVEGRTTLRPGVHQPFARLGIEVGAIFFAAACVFRNGLIDWDEIESVGVRWDRYSVYALAREGTACVYLPQRLSRYRRHLGTHTMRSGSIDAEAKLRGARSALRCSERMLSDPRVSECHPWIRAWRAEHQTTLAIALLRLGITEGRRSAALAGVRGHACGRSLATLALTLLPPRLGERLASARRR